MKPKLVARRTLVERQKMRDRICQAALAPECFMRLNEAEWQRLYRCLGRLVLRELR